MKKKMIYLPLATMLLFACNSHSNSSRSATTYTNDSCMQTISAAPLLSNAPFEYTDVTCTIFLSDSQPQTTDKPIISRITNDTMPFPGHAGDCKTINTGKEIDYPYFCSNSVPATTKKQKQHRTQPTK